MKFSGFQLWIFAALATCAESVEAQQPVVLHLDASDFQWSSAEAAGRRLAERNANASCRSQRLLLKPRRQEGESSSEPSRRLAERLLTNVEELQGTSWQHLSRVGIDIADLGCSSLEDANATLQRLRQQFAEDLDFIELDEQIYKPLQSLAVVDPFWPTQYGTQRCNFEGAWQQLEALTTSPTEVVVALIDTGLTFGHEDLQGRVWTNRGEIPGNGRDDDGNGYIDDVHGFNFVDYNGNPVDDGGHGTHNAGLIAAQLNDRGIAGAAGRNQYVKLMVVKALTASGGYKSDAISAVNYAMAMGAQISSNSWGGHSESQSLQQAIQVAMEAGHLFVSAAGNDNANADQYPFYPCVYPHVLCVAASNSEDQFTFFSNYGVQSVELVAPGQNIISTYLGVNEYTPLTGTSFGTSLVAGAAALLFSWLRGAVNTVLTVEDIRWLLLDTAQELSWTSGFVGNGMLDVNAAALKALSGTGHSWLVGPWSICRRVGCPMDSPGIRYRSVTCVDSRGSDVEWDLCSGGSECQDLISGWRDSYGAACSVYGDYQWCTSAGGVGPGWQSWWGSIEEYAASGAHAFEVCCSCGSGRVGLSNTPSRSQECPEPVMGPDENEDGVDDCFIPPETTTTVSTVTTVTSVTTTSRTTATITTNTRTSTTTSFISTTSVTHTSSTVTTVTTTSATTTTITTTTRTDTTSTSVTTSTETTYSTITYSTTTTSSATLTTKTSSSTRTSSTSDTTVTTSSSTFTTVTTSSLTSSSTTQTRSTSTSSSKTESTTTSSSSTRTTKTTTSTSKTSTVTSTSTATSTSTSATSTTSSSTTSSSTTSTTSLSTTTTLTVQLASIPSPAHTVKSTLLLVGTNVTPPGISASLQAELAATFGMDLDAVEVLSIKAALAAMFYPGRSLSDEELGPSARRTQMTVMEPALETDFQLLLPVAEEETSMTVDEAMDAISAVSDSPEPLSSRMGQVLESFGLMSRQNVSLRLTRPSTRTVQSVFVTSEWSPCGGEDAACVSPSPLRYRDVWCATLDDLASRRAEGLCAGSAPTHQEPCPPGMPRPPLCGWHLSPWSPCLSELRGPGNPWEEEEEFCNVSGVGLQYREVRCLSPEGDLACSGSTPRSQRACQCVAPTMQAEAPQALADMPESESMSLGMVAAASSAGALLLCCCACCCAAALRGKGPVKVAAEPEKHETVGDRDDRSASTSEGNSSKDEGSKTDEEADKGALAQSPGADLESEFLDESEATEEQMMALDVEPRLPRAATMSGSFYSSANGHDRDSLLGRASVSQLQAACEKRGKKTKGVVEREEFLRLLREAGPPSVAELRAACHRQNLATAGCVERADLERVLLEAAEITPIALSVAACRDRLRSATLPLDAMGVAPPRTDSPRSPVSPSRVSAAPGTGEEEDEEEDADVSPASSPMGKRPSKQPARAASDASTALPSPASYASAASVKGSPSSARGSSKGTLPERARGGSKPRAPGSAAPGPGPALRAEPAPPRGPKRKAEPRPPELEMDLVESPLEQSRGSRTSRGSLRRTATWTSSPQRPTTPHLSVPASPPRKLQRHPTEPALARRGRDAPSPSGGSRPPASPSQLPKVREE